jgi:hypothetical protein
MTWLPLIGWHLPHDWIDLDAVTDVAAKRDDADVPVSLWNRCITVVLPVTDDDLQCLRLLVHRRQSYRLATEFQGFMRRTHGNTW